MDTDVPGEIRSRLRALADQRRAAGQQAYMKSEMPFLGVRVPAVRRIAHAAGRVLDEPDAARTAALTLWDEAAYREERYAGMALLGLPLLRGDEGIIPVVERMVRVGGWWDYTDDLAGRLAELHDAHPDRAADLVRGWSRDSDLWIRRSAILSQRGRGQRVDAGLLTEVIEPNRSDPEFFIRKAIGWALRDYAKSDPDWVRAYARAVELSPLSRREALRHL